MTTLNGFNRTYCTNATPTAASGSVSFTVADSTKLTAGLAKIFPQQAGRYDPDDDYVTGAQCITITGISGSTVTATLGVNGSTAQAVQFGYYVKMEPAAIGAGPATLYIDGASFAATGAGVRAAYAALVALNGGHGKIEVAPYTPILWGNTEPLDINSDNFEFYAPASSPITKSSTSPALTPICVNVPAGGGGVVTSPGVLAGRVGAASSLTASMTRNTNIATMAGGIPAGLVAGDFVEFVQAGSSSETGTSYEGDFLWITQVASVTATTVSTVDPAPMQIVSGGGNAGTCQKVTLRQNVKITATIDQGVAVLGGAGFYGIYLGPGCDIDVVVTGTFAAGARLETSYGLTRYWARAEHCGEDQAGGASAVAGANFVFQTHLIKDLKLISHRSRSFGIIRRGVTQHGGYLEATASEQRNLKDHHIWSTYNDVCIGNFSPQPSGGTLVGGACTGYEATGTSYDVTIGFLETLGNWSSGILSTAPNNGSTLIKVVSGRSQSNGLGGGGAADVNPQSGSVSWMFSDAFKYDTVVDGATRTSLIGTLIPVTFAAGNFTANAGATITVQSGDQTAFDYTMITPTLMKVSVVLVTVSITVATPTIISILIPDGRTAQGSVRERAIVTQAGVSAPNAIAFVDATATTISVVSDPAATAFALATNNLTIQFDILIPVNI